MATQTYTIPEGNFDGLSAQLAKLNKRAKRLNVSLIGMTSEVAYVEREYQEEHEFSGPKQKPRWYKDGTVPSPLGHYFYRATGRVRQWLAVTVTGETPKFAGWSLVAVLNHVKADSGEVLEVIRAVPGESVPASFRGRGPVCDHCKASRRRNDTYVVRHENGTYKQVGANCLADFLGHKNPHSLAAMAELLACFAEICGGAQDEEYFGSGGGRTTFSLDYFLDFVAHSIRKSGWLSRTAARDSVNGSGRATADISWQGANPSRYDLADKDFVAYWAQGTQAQKDEDSDLVESAIGWAATLHLVPNTEMSDYLSSINAIARSGLVEYKLAGYAASILIAYRNDLNRRQAAAKQSTSEHFGTIGERAEFTLTLNRVTPIDGMYPSYLHRFTDEAGNVATWFASETVKLGMDEGKTYRVKATPKKHDAYKGTKQTILSRVAVVAELAPVAS